MKSQAEVLRERISLLESRQTHELSFLKEQIHQTYESFKPINLLKSTFHEVKTSPDLKDDMLNNVIGLTTGYISKKIILGTAHNPITRLLGNMLQFTVGNFVAKNSETIKAVGEVVIRKIFESISKSKHTSLEVSINKSVGEQMKDYDKD